MAARLVAASSVGVGTCMAWVTSFGPTSRRRRVRQATLLDCGILNLPGVWVTHPWWGDTCSWNENRWADHLPVRRCRGGACDADRGSGRNATASGWFTKHLLHVWVRCHVRIHDSLPRRVPVVAGIVAAHVAWVVGYLVTAVIFRQGGREAVSNPAFGEMASRPDTLQAVAWVFYSAHGAPVAIVPADRAEATASFTATLVGGDGFTPLLYAVPVVVLVAAGAAVAWYAGSTGPVDGLVAGFAVAPGYLALAWAASMASTITWSMGADGTAAPQATAVLLLAGLIYPFVCAGSGGLFAGAVTGLVGSHGEPPVDNAERENRR